MFKKNKIAVAVAVAVSLFAGSAMAAANDGDDTDTLFPAQNGTATDLQPKIWFDYKSAMDGVLIDFTNILDASGDPATSIASDNTCGDSIVTAYVPLSDAAVDCTQTTVPSGGESAAAANVCTWMVPNTLTEGNVYAANVTHVSLATGITTPAKSDANCRGGGANGYQDFKVDTSTAPVVEPVAPPAKVTITSPAADATCVAASGGVNYCTFEFTHANTPDTTWYNVWVDDKNGIQADSTAISDNGADGKNTYGGGWFKIDNSTTAATDTGFVSCSTSLAGLRTCSLKIGATHGAYAALPTGGSKYKIWINAYNSKGLSGWSTPLTFSK